VTSIFRVKRPGRRKKGVLPEHYTASQPRRRLENCIELCFVAYLSCLTEDFTISWNCILQVSSREPTKQISKALPVSGSNQHVRSHNSKNTDEDKSSIFLITTCDA
jgi:hypothetical protein